MEWLNKITYRIDIDWVLDDAAIKSSLIACGLSDEQLKAIVTEMNQNLVAINMTSLNYDHSAVLEKALSSTNMWADTTAAFNKAQEKVCPLPNGYSTDSEWQQLIADDKTFNDKCIVELTILRDQCKYIQGWQGLTSNHLQRHERTCHVCKEYGKVSATRGSHHTNIKRQLAKIEQHYNEINRVRNNAVIAIGRRISYAPYKKCLHLNKDSTEDIILVGQNKEYLLKEL